MSVRSPAAAVMLAALLLAALLVLEGRALGGAWAVQEEAAVLDRARGGALVADREAGVAFPLLLAPTARTLSGPAGYGLAQALAACLWALALVPAYLLARTLLPPRAALVASGAALVAPVGLYATAALPDALALLLALCSFALALRAEASRSPGPLALALTAAATAAMTRPWLVLLPFALALFYALPRLAVRALIRWPGSLVWAAAAVAWYALGLILAELAPPVGEALLHPVPTLRAAAAGLASAAVAVLVAPWALAAAAPAPVRATPLYRLLAVCLPPLALAGGVAAAATPDRAVEERALVVLGPLVLPVAIRAWRDGPSVRRLALAAAILAGAAVALPALARPSPGALGVAAALPGGGSRAAVAATAVSVTVLATVAALALRRRPPAVAAGAFLLLALAAHGVVWSELRTQAREERPDDWVDAAAGAGSRVVLVGPEGQLDASRVAAVVLWNRSLRAATAVDPAGAEIETGVIGPAPEGEYLLVRGYEPAGEVVAAHPDAVLVRREPVLRAARTVEGIYEDGWSGPAAVLRGFGGPTAPGTVVVTAGRAAWGGPDRPGEVVVSTGPLEGEAEPRASGVISAGEELVLEAPVPPPPFRVVVTVTPTFSPAEFGGADARQLGAQLSFSFRPPG